MMRRHILLLVSFFSVAMMAGVSTPVFAATPSFSDDPYNGLCDQAAQNNKDIKPPVCNTKPTNPVSGSNSLILKAVDIVSIVAGIVAVIMVIFSGVQMILSSGDAAKFAKARNTLIFVAVGIAVIVLARTIIGFILERV